MCRFRYQSLVLVGALALGCVSGCGFTRVSETHMLQARSSTGEVSYYRVRIEASSDMAKTEYRSGLYDAYALDSLFGNADDSADGLEAILARKRVEAVSKAFSDYYAALGQPINEQQMADFERRIARSLESPFGVADRGSGGRQHRKFAVIYSSNASAVEEAIAGLVEEKETAAGIMSVLAQRERSKHIEAKVESEGLKEVTAKLEKYADDVKKLLEETNSYVISDGNIVDLTGAAQETLKKLLSAIKGLKVQLGE